MNIFKKLKQWFSKQEKPCAERAENNKQDSPAIAAKDEKLNEGVRVLMEMPYNIVHPANLMESLLMAIAYQAREPVCCSVKDIVLYSIYDHETGAFLGSFYALEHDGLFYGNIVGSAQIFSCSKTAFRFEKTDMLYAPLRSTDERILVLVCVYDRHKAKLSAVCLKKMDEFMQNEEILHKFDKGTSFNEAYSFWEENFSQK